MEYDDAISTQINYNKFGYYCVFSYSQFLFDSYLNNLLHPYSKYFKKSNQFP